jgi:hypothetical protein
MSADGLTYVLAAFWNSQTCPLNLSLEETELKMRKINYHSTVAITPVITISMSAKISLNFNGNGHNAF